jgi:RNA polymerase sigma factor (sigma-70 family)
MNELLQHLRRTSLLRDVADATDGQLLDSFIARREEGAIEALVRRHAPMVWGVCRRLLRNPQDAEDAFQATFLVLVRKAASIVPRGMVANWLHGVAYQSAVRVRAAAARRSARERQMTEMSEPAAPEPDLWNELQPLLDQELNRLPARFRAVILLCDLEGKTRKETALHLGVPEGTVAGWLARARAMLARRLSRHGLGVSAGALAGVLSQSPASACVPASTVSSTIKAVTLVAAGKMATAGVISAQVAAVTEGVIKAMLFTKLKLMSAVVLVLFLGVGSGVLLHGASARRQTSPVSRAESPQPAAAEKAKAEPPKEGEKAKQQKDEPIDKTKEEKDRALGEPIPNNARLKALLQKRYDTLKKAADWMEQLFQKGAASLEEVRRAKIRLYQAEVDLCETARKRIAVLEKIVDVHKALEDVITQQVAKGIASPTVALEATVSRLEAEIALEREKAKLPGPAKKP